ncbi:hypothetical protein ACH3XW_36295 [Acanthocheilonema viteae]
MRNKFSNNFCARTKKKKSNYTLSVGNVTNADEIRELTDHTPLLSLTDNTTRPIFVICKLSNFGLWPVSLDLRGKKKKANRLQVCQKKKKNCSYILIFARIPNQSEIQVLDINNLLFICKVPDRIVNKESTNK